MARFYLCSSCTKNFSLNDAQDGYKLGFEQGFLCPFCHTNLIESSESDDISQLKLGYTYVITLCVTMYMLLEYWDEWAFLPMVVGLISIFTIITIPFAWINRSALFGDKVVHTKRLR